MAASEEKRTAKISYECHGHLMMDGVDFAQASRRNRNGVDISALRSALASLSGAGVVYYRDGGDRYGVSLLGREIAQEYGIEAVTPVFAIYKRGRYGSVAGKSYDGMESYRSRVAEVRRAGGDFVKLILSGIITFRSFGELSCEGIEEEELAELVHIAHGEGFRVMAHVNGAETIRAAVLAGVDSVEHGYFADRDAMEAMAEKKTLWVPTLAAVEAFTGREGIDTSVAERTLREQIRCIEKAKAMGIPVAAGSDSGAVGVPHGRGTMREYELLSAAGLTEADIEASNVKLREVFSPGNR